METPTIYPLESFVKNKLSRPGLKFLMFGIDENGIPYNQEIVEIVTFYFESGETNDLKLKAESIADSDEKQRILNFANSGERKIVAKVVNADHASTNYLQDYLRTMINTNKKLPQEFQTYLQLKEKINGNDYSNLNDQEYTQYLEIRGKLSELPVNKLKESLSDDERFLQLKSLGIKLKRTNKDCTTSEELELLRIYRRLDDKKRRTLQAQFKQQNQVVLPSGFI
jgi:hypothetical protein